MALAQPKTSHLPASMQARREKLETEDAAAKTAAEETTAKSTEQASTELKTESAEPATEQAPEKVELTREEFNKLQAARDRSAAAEVAAETARLEAEELRHRLTEAEQKGKEVPAVSKEPELGFTDTDVQLSPEEQEEYGESEGFVAKIARREVANAIRKFNTGLENRIKALETSLNNTSTTVQRSNQKRFVDRVREKATDVDALIQNEHFKDFLQARVPMTDLTYNEALAAAHNNENLQAVLDILGAFRTKYGIVKSDRSGYNGGTPAASSAGETKTEESQKRYTMADRRKVSEDYQKGRITAEELAEFRKKFNAANDAGLVDP